MWNHLTSNVYTPVANVYQIENSYWYDFALWFLFCGRPLFMIIVITEQGLKFEVWSLLKVQLLTSVLADYAYDQCSCLYHYIPQFFFSYPSLAVILKLASNVRVSTCLYLVIFFPLCPESLMHKNPQRHKIIRGMRPVGRKDRMIDLNMCFSRNILSVK